MVYECFKNVPECRDKRIPIIGIGGISTWEDALEYIMAGATAVQVGTATFINPAATLDIIEGIERFMREKKIEDIAELAGVART